jgi:hypothetical protein
VLDFYGYVENRPVNYSDPFGHLKEDKSNSCCDWKNIESGMRELAKVLDSAQVKGRPIFSKYKKCLGGKAFPQETIKCVDSKGCGDFNPLQANVVNITPLGSKGRKGICGPVASSLVHELVHYCQFIDPAVQNFSESEAWGAECELFGTGCACARNPTLCGYR